MKIEIDQPGFMIFGPIPTPRPVPPPPPPHKQPSDDFLSRHSQRSLKYAALRPVIKDGEPTGGWLVALISPDDLFGKKWIVKPNQDEAYDWCKRADKVIRQKSLTYNFFFEMMLLTVTYSTTWPLTLTA